MKILKLLIILLFCATLTRAQDNATAVRPLGQRTIAFSATPNFDFSVSDNLQITLTGNVTSSTAVGLEAGHNVSIEVCQDGVGSRTFSPPPQFVGWVAIVATINTCTLEIAKFDGTSAIVPLTATGGGGGSGTVNSGTGGKIAYYGATGTTISNDANLDESVTHANGLTYAGVAGIFSPIFSPNGTGAMTFIGNNGTCSGAASGKSVICLGDLTSNSAQISNNGLSFFPIALHQSTSPTPHGILIAETFPQIFASPTGTAGQPFISGGPSADPGPGALNLAGGATIISGIMPKLNHPTSTVFGDQVNTFTAAGTLDLSASTVASALRAPNVAGLTTAISGAIGYDTTNNNFHGGVNSADAKLAAFTVTPANSDCVKWVVTSGNYLLGDTGSACGAGGATALSGLTAATVANSINNGDNAQIWNWALTTAGKVAFKITENSASTATGTPVLFQVSSIAASTANPVQFDFNGNGLRMSTAGLLAKIGTGALDGPSLSGVIPNGSMPALTGDVTNSSGTVATTIAANAVTASKSAVVMTRRVCDIAVGDTSATVAIANAQLGPQKRVCYIPEAATVVEMDVSADAGTPNVIVAVNHAGSVSNIVSAALATAAAGGIACSKTTAVTGIDGATTCSATLQNTAIAAGDYLELVSGTAGGTAKLMTIHVIYTVN